MLHHLIVDLLHGGGGGGSGLYNGDVAHGIMMLMMYLKIAKKSK
jgi:hypothetical protein